MSSDNECLNSSGEETDDDHMNSSDDEQKVGHSSSRDTDELMTIAQQALFPQGLLECCVTVSENSNVATMLPFMFRHEVLSIAPRVDTSKPFVFAVHDVQVCTVGKACGRASAAMLCQDSFYDSLDASYQHNVQHVRDKAQQGHSFHGDRSSSSFRYARRSDAATGDVLNMKQDVVDADAVPCTNEQCTVYVHGVDPHGRTVSVKILNFRPYCIVDLSGYDVSACSAIAQSVARAIEERLRVPTRCIQHKVVALQKFRFWWSSPEDVCQRAKFVHAVLYFPNSETCIKAGQVMRDNGLYIKIQGRGLVSVKLKCEEYTIESHTKWYNHTRVDRRGWCVVDGGQYSLVDDAQARATFSHLEMITDQKNVHGLDEKYHSMYFASAGPGNIVPRPDEMPPELWRSTDIETLNPTCDGSPPDALDRSNSIFMISDVFAWMNKAPPVLKKDCTSDSRASVKTHEHTVYTESVLQTERAQRVKARDERRAKRMHRRAHRSSARAYISERLREGKSLSYDDQLNAEIADDEELASSESDGDEAEEAFHLKKDRLRLAQAAAYDQMRVSSYPWPVCSDVTIRNRMDVNKRTTGVSIEDIHAERLDSPGVVAGRAFLRVLYVLGPCAAVKGTIVLSFDNEADLLSAWRDVGRLMLPDVTTGWNWDKYDHPYLFRRATMLNVRRFFRQSRLFCDTTRVWMARVASNAMGDNTLMQMTQGYTSFDLMPFVRSNYRMTNYKLKTVSSQLLGRSKIDVSYEFVNRSGVSKVSLDLAVSGIYCVVDSELVLELVQATGAASTMTQFCRIMAVEASEYSQRGQQVRVRNQMLDDCRAQGFVMDGLVRRRARVDDYGHRIAGEEEDLYGCAAEESSYEGGYVVDGALGYVDEPIVTLDFASLYPSIQQRYNICPSTFIPPNVPEDQVNEWESKGLVVERIKGTLGVHRFVQNEVGVMPKRLRAMFVGRKSTKKLMAQAYADGRDEEGRALNAKQNAQKFTMNSYYGALAAVGGMLTMKEVSDAITARGRELTKGACMFVEKEYGHLGWFIRAGDTDSIMVQMPPSADARSQGHRAIMHEAWQRGTELTQRFNKEIFREPIKYELEKIYIRAFFVARKKYATFQVEENEDNKPTLKARGLECERRDNPKYVRDAQKKVMKALLQRGDKRAALAVARAAVKKLGSSAPPLDDIVIYKELRAGKGLGPPPSAHVACAFRMGHLLRNAMPSSGERIGYLVSTKPDERNGIPPPGFVAPSAALTRTKPTGSRGKNLNAGSALSAGRAVDAQVSWGKRSCFSEQVTASEKSSKDTKQDSEKVYLLVRTLDEVRDNPKEHPLNVQYYLEHQLCKPLLRVLPDKEKELLLASVQEVKARSQGIRSIGCAATITDADSSMVDAGATNLVGGKEALALLSRCMPQRKRQRGPAQQAARKECRDGGDHDDDVEMYNKTKSSKPKTVVSLSSFSCVCLGPQ